MGKISLHDSLLSSPSCCSERDSMLRLVNVRLLKEVDMTEVVVTHHSSDHLTPSFRVHTVWGLLCSQIITLRSYHVHALDHSYLMQDLFLKEATIQP